jgi:hypothetical protein
LLECERGGEGEKEAGEGLAGVKKGGWRKEENDEE